MRHLIAIIVLIGAAVLMFRQRDVPRGEPAGDTPIPMTAQACDASVQRDAPCFTPFDTRPTLSNAEDVRAAMLRGYTQYAGASGITGTTHVFVLIDDSGSVRNALLNRSSGDTRLDTSSLRVAHEMVFSPAVHDGKRTWAWFEVPFVYPVR
jgi:TonB family protein